ncbi:hypothetical protein [Streptomyces microflavus]|uniref:hypothetical protein n=1 Tax=Streptomyces microflavus TaxID=1919 RepID=UPI00389B025B
MTEFVYPEMPKHSLVVLIGPSGAGKSTIARTWPASQVLFLGALREAVSDDFSVKSNVLSVSAVPAAHRGRLARRQMLDGGKAHRQCRPSARPVASSRTGSVHSHPGHDRSLR